MAEAMFGGVPGRGQRDGANGKAIRGRVRFADAVAVSAVPEGGWIEPLMVPSILSSPKVTAFQHYLAQDGPSGRQALTAYIRGDKTTVRGHKLYSGVRFAGKVHFDNLTVEVMEERTRKGGLMFRVVGTQWKGVLHPMSAPVPDPMPGVKLNLVVATGGGILQLKYVPG